MLKIIEDFIPPGRKNRPGSINPCQYITIHNTGNSSAGSGARNHAGYVKSANAEKSYVSWHYTVDEKEAFQHLPDNETAYHAGDGNGPGNTKSIGIEICMNTDGDLRAATDNAVVLTAALCRKHGIDVRNVVQHYNWTRKNCPQMIRAGKPYGWDEFIEKVKKLLPSAPQAGEANVLGNSAVSALQAEQWAIGKGATSAFAGLAQKYWTLAPFRGGVNPALAFCQAALETGYGKFGGNIDESYHNPCGLKSESCEGVAFQHFDDWENGVTAHLDHLALYAGAEGYPRTGSPDPRHFKSLFGRGRTIEEMSQSWCPSNPGYAAALRRLIAALGEEHQTKTPNEITVENAASDGVISTKAYWLNVLNGSTTPDPKYVKTVLDRYHTALKH